MAMQYCKKLATITFGVFFSVFLLTSTGLSYFTNEELGGIILNQFFFFFNVLQPMKV